MNDAQRFIPTGFTDLDNVLGGGWAVGRLTEIWGAHASALLDASARAALADHSVEIIDIEEGARPEVMLEGISRFDRCSHGLLIAGPWEHLHEVDLPWQRRLQAFFRALLPKLHLSGVALVCWWQDDARRIRRLPGDDYEMFPAASAIKFYASTRVELRRSVMQSLFAGGIDPVQVLAKVVKNKLAPPFQEARIALR